jgi:hypothetical protein
MSRLALIAAFAALCAAAPAVAKVPDPRFSQCDAVLDDGRAFLVAPRDVSNAPLSFEEVTLDFSASPVRLYAEQESGTTVDCVRRTLTRYTTIQGVATFHPRFAIGCADASVLVMVNGVWLRHVPARSTDLDGDGTVGVNDVAVFANAFREGSVRPELDFDGSGGAPGLGDFTRIVQGFLAAAKASYCP